MEKWVISSIAAIVVVLTLAGGAMIYVAQKEQAQLLARFAVLNKQRVAEAALAIEHRLSSAADNLRAVGRLLGSLPADERGRALAATLALVNAFRRIETFDLAGRRVLSVDDPSRRSRFQPEAFDAAMAQVVGRAATLPAGAVRRSPRIASDPARWFYIFATPLPRAATDSVPGVVAAAVDTKPFFDPLAPLIADDGSRLLVLDPAGRPALLTGPTGTQHAGTLDFHGAPSRLHVLLGQMLAGHRGALSIDEGEARSAGLAGEPLVVAYAPIGVPGGGHFSIATFSSTAPLRAHQRAALLGRGLSSAVLVACLTALVTFIFYAARRTTVLRDRLRHATEIEYLHDKTQKILDNIPTGILALSDAEVTVAVNRVLRARMPKEVLGVPLPRAFPEATATTIARLRELIARTRSSSEVQSRFGEFLGLFGEEERYNIHVVPLEPRIPDARFLLVIEDLSEVRALESKLLRSEKLATVGVLSAGIAHEIGTPLGVVRGRAEYMLGKLGLDHPQARGVQVIIEQIDHVTATLRQLLDFSCIKPAAVRSVGVLAVVRTVLELLRLETEGRRISALAAVPDTLPDVAADPDQLQQVMVNLVLNACDACAPGGRVAIRGRLEPATKAADQSRVRIEVEDDGCGIPEERRHQVFDPFFTTKKRGAGSGLGLSIVAQIVRNHRAELELWSEPGRGTCVTLLWPLAPQATPVEEHHANPS